MDQSAFQVIDRRVTHWLAEHGLTLLRISIGLVFVWFGVLKFWPGLSPADQLATETIDLLSFGLIAEDLARVLLAILEVAIGIGLIAGKFMRFTLLLLVGQMLGAVTPLFLFPKVTWSHLLVPTLEGQYILKNMVLVAAALTIGATVRGGGLIDDPEVFDITRKPYPHIAFGVGTHFCMGSHMARLEMRVTLEEFLGRFSKVSLAAPPERLQSNFISGIKRLPVNLL